MTQGCVCGYTDNEATEQDARSIGTAKHFQDFNMTS